MDWFSIVREIKITKHINLLLPLKDLIISALAKTTAYSIL
jgi:hypothetical protein